MLALSLVAATGERLAGQELEFAAGAGRTTLEGTRYVVSGLEQDRVSLGLGLRWKTFSSFELLVGAGVARETMPTLRMTVVEVPLLLRTNPNFLRMTAGIVGGFPVGCRYQELGTHHPCEPVPAPRGRAQISPEPDLSVTVGLGVYVPISEPVRLNVQARFTQALTAMVEEECSGYCTVLSDAGLGDPSQSYRRKSIAIIVGVIWNRSRPSAADIEVLQEIDRLRR
jgi:hypothetical protein